MKVIHVARKPLTATVAETAIAHGTGGLNIDESRIGESKQTPASPSRTAGVSQSGSADGSLRRETGQESRHNPNIGRWPANVILQHQEGCEQVGVVPIKGDNDPRGKDGNRYGSLGLFQGGEGNTHESSHRGFVGKDGTETVDAWDCVEGCPVAALDEQSGDKTSGSGNFKKASSATLGGGAKVVYGQESRPFGAEQVSYGDSGGVSRYFKQVKP